MTALLSRTVRTAQGSMDTYFHEINETPLLSADEERELAYRIEDGDSEARDHLVRANLRLVVRLARGYVCKGLGLEDLIAEGNLGLLRAVEGYDVAMNTRFSTYASFWIKQSIKRAIINTSRPIRLPSYMVELMKKWRHAAELLQEELGRTPTETEVASKLGLPAKKLKIVQKGIRIYNAMPQSDEGETEWSLDERVADEGVLAPDAGVSGSDELREVLGMLDRLEAREAAVLRLRFGLDGEDPKTLKEIGECLDLTRERVRQIERDALKKLRTKLEAA